MRIELASPTSLPNSMATITVPAARAIWRLALLEVVTGEDYNQTSVLASRQKAVTSYLQIASGSHLSYVI